MADDDLLENGSAAERFARALADLHQRAGKPALAALQHEANSFEISLPPSKLSDWLNGKSVPADWHVLAWLIRSLDRRVGAEPGQSRPEGAWQTLHREAQDERNQARGRPSRPRRRRSAPPFVEPQKTVSVPPTAAQQRSDEAALQCIDVLADLRNVFTDWPDRRKLPIVFFKATEDGDLGRLLQDLAAKADWIINDEVRQRLSGISHVLGHGAMFKKEIGTEIFNLAPRLCDHGSSVLKAHLQGRELPEEDISVRYVAVLTRNAFRPLQATMESSGLAAVLARFLDDDEGVQPT